VVFRVRDNGIGIPAPMLHKVFDLFTQIENSLDRAQGGLGVGLTLVRQLVEMHGGRVDVVSRGADQGSEFSVRIPRLHSALDESPLAVSRSRDAAHARSA
jgi:signal transduction histidine kinase